MLAMSEGTSLKVQLKKEFVQAILAIGGFLGFVALTAYVVVRMPQADLTATMVSALISMVSGAYSFYFAIKARQSQE